MILAAALVMKGSRALEDTQDMAEDLLCAEAKMGELLVGTERAQGKRTDLVTPSNQVNPTLSELGLTKRESMVIYDFN